MFQVSIFLYLGENENSCLLHYKEKRKYLHFIRELYGKYGNIDEV